jgi:hypothetical protein
MQVITVNTGIQPPFKACGGVGAGGVMVVIGCKIDLFLLI